MLGKEDTAVKGNFLSALAMFTAVAITLIDIVNPLLVIIGISIGAVIGSLIALKVKMTSIPEMVALFNGFGVWLHSLLLGLNFILFQTIPFNMFL